MIWSDLVGDHQLQVVLRDMRNEHVRTLCDFPELRILVRADGSSGSIDAIQILGRLSRVVEGKTHGIVYDFIDNYGESYLRKSKTRKKHYEKQGWRIEDSWKSFS
jgi:superfamily II DNA or RNA helicase